MPWNRGGSVDRYLLKDSPGGDKESNWLPAPAGQASELTNIRIEVER